MSISKKIRFDIFKRDKFVCQYCGKTVPNITLEIDHITPKSKKGTDDINNLITSCFDCNRGKRNVLLKVIPNTIAFNLKILKKKEIQVKEYNKFIKKINNRLSREAQKIDNVYTGYFKDYGFSESFKINSLHKFQKVLPIQEIIEALHLACQKINNKDSAITYFCGICWNKIKAKTDPSYNLKRILYQYWKNQPRGSGYLKPSMLQRWTNKYSEEKIKEAMDKAKGSWNELFNILESKE